MHGIGLDIEAPAAAPERLEGLAGPLSHDLRDPPQDRLAPPALPGIPAGAAADSRGARHGPPARTAQSRNWNATALGPSSGQSHSRQGPFLFPRPLPECPPDSGSPLAIATGGRPERPLHAGARLHHRHDILEIALCTVSCPAPKPSLPLQGCLPETASGPQRTFPILYGAWPAKATQSS